MQYMILARLNAEAETLIASDPDDFNSRLMVPEREQARAHYVEGAVRQIWRAADDTAGVVLIFEAASTEHLQELLDAYPLVREGLLDLSIVPLAPYEGFGPHAGGVDLVVGGAEARP